MALVRALAKLGQRAGEPIEIFATVLFGNRDQQAIGKPLVGAAQIEAGDQALLLELSADRCRAPARHPTANSLKKGALPKPSV